MTFFIFFVKIPFDTDFFYIFLKKMIILSLSLLAFLGFSNTLLSK